MAFMPVHIHIDYNCGIPICSQVTAQIKRMVVNGSLKVGEKLPSIRDLAKSLSINPTTVSRIYTALEREGVITLRQGQGAYISSQKPHLSPTEIQRQIGQHVRTLLVEGLRLGMDLPTIQELLNLEYQAILLECDNEKAKC